MMILKGTAITLVLVFLARIAGRKYDGYLIAMYGASQTAIFFLTWIIGAWANFVTWWHQTPVYEFFNMFSNMF